MATGRPGDGARGHRNAPPFVDNWPVLVDIFAPVWTIGALRRRRGYAPSTGSGRLSAPGAPLSAPRSTSGRELSASAPQHGPCGDSARRPHRPHAYWGRRRV